MEPKTQYVSHQSVNCDGGQEKNSEHPAIFLNMGEKETVVCPYCSKKFILRSRSEAANTF